MRIETSRDVFAAAELDPSLWTATSMPRTGVHVDPQLPAQLDTDGTGRITHEEVVAAIKWTFSVLEDRTPVDLRKSGVTVSSLSPDDPDARSIAEAIACVVDGRRGESTESIEVEPEQLRAAIESPTPSLDGVPVPSESDQSSIAKCIRAAASATKGDAPTIGAARLTRGDFDAVEAVMDACRELEQQTAALVVSREWESCEDYEHFAMLLDKIDEYFAHGAEKGFVGQCSIAESPALEDLPLTWVDPSGVLNLDGFIHPHYAALLDDFRQKVLTRELPTSGDRLSSRDWLRVRARFSRAKAAERKIEALGLTGLTCVADLSRLVRVCTPEAMQMLKNRYASEPSVRVSRTQVELVERLSLYQQHLLGLVNNFVSFPDLYDRSALCWFEMGRLILDGRVFGFAIHVGDRARHVTMAAGSRMFVMYVEVRPADPHPRYEVAVAVTAGGRGNIVRGKRGVFVDRSGDEHDAEVVALIENPISISEALFAPFRRLTKTIGDRIESLTEEADTRLQSHVGDVVGDVGRPASHSSSATTVADGGFPANSPIGTQPAARFGVGTKLLGGSVAVAAIGSALAYIVDTLSTLRWWFVVAGFSGALLAVMLPALLLAAWKLKRRDLGPIIEASGWAVNGDMRLTRRLQRVFTMRPQRPTRLRDRAW